MLTSITLKKICKSVTLRKNIIVVYSINYSVFFTLLYWSLKFKKKLVLEFLTFFVACVDVTLGNKIQCYAQPKFTYSN